VIDRATEIRVRAELERAVCTLLASSDGLFYAHVLIRMGRQVSDDVDTMAVTVDRGRVVLLVNPRFWDSLADRPHAREGVLIHEVLHVVLRHLERGLSVPDRETFNIAADLAVNEIVGAHRLPEGAYLIENMPEDLGLSRGATAEAHYDRLKQAEREGKRRPGGASGADSAGRGNHTLWPVDGGADHRTCACRPMNWSMQLRGRRFRRTGGSRAISRVQSRPPSPAAPAPTGGRCCASSVPPGRSRT
jgi:hypothetical protein